MRFSNTSPNVVIYFIVLSNAAIVIVRLDLLAVSVK